MQKRVLGCSEANGKDNHRKKWAIPGRFLSKKLGSIFSGVLGNKKSPGTCSSNGGKDVLHRNGEGLSRSQDEKQTQDFKKVESESTEKKLEYEIQPFLSFKKLLEAEVEEGKQKTLDVEKSSSPPELPYKLPRKESLSLSGFFNKNSMKFIKSKTNKANNSSNFFGGCSKVDCGSLGITSSVRLTGRQGSSGHLVRVPSKILTTRRKLRTTRSFGKKVTKQFEQDPERKDDEDRQEESTGKLELCKKRILMGEKCKPLNSSGTLHYDKNGVMLPELLP